MANEINLYDPRSMAGSFNKRMPVTTFVRDNFFGITRTFPTEHVDVDFRKGSRAVAPFVAPNIGGINVERRGYETRTYKPPRVAPERDLNPEVLNKRLMGENIHTTMSPEDREDYYLRLDAQELDDMISRREELMAVQLLTTGKINVRGYADENMTTYIDDDIDFNFTNITTLTGNDQWGETSADPYGDLEEAVEMVLKAGYNGGACLVGKAAWPKLRDNSTFQKLLDNRRMQMGLIAPELRTVDGSGVKYIGDIPDLGLQLFVYYSWYMDVDGTVKELFPEDYVVIAPFGIGEMLYGAITQIEEEDKRFHTYEGARVPQIFTDIKGNKKTMRLSSRPLPKPFDVDAWAVINTKGGSGS